MNNSYQISLPDCLWEYIEEHMKNDYLIKSRSDAIISLLRNAYPELKVKINEAHAPMKENVWKRKQEVKHE